MMSTLSALPRTSFLSGTAVDLVLLEERDAPDLTRWMNDADITQFLKRGDQPVTLEFEIEWVRKLRDRPNDLVLGIWQRSEARLIGTVSLNRINALHQYGSLGIAIGEKACWSNGFGRDAIKTLLTYAFYIRNLRQVDLTVLSNNPRGQRCYESCGFVHVGTLPQRFMKRGQWVDELIMVAWRTDS